MATDETPLQRQRPRTNTRHQELAETLLAQIGDGTFSVGDKLPTEEQLCLRYSLARGTVRRALGRLEQLGMIDRRAGTGTTIIAATPTPTYQPLAQSAFDIATLAAETRLAKPEMGEVEADATLAQRIGTRPGTMWFRMQGQRIWRKRSGAPLCWSEHYQRADAPRDQLLTGQVFVDQLAKQWVDQTISAALLEPHIADALDAEPYGAALVITRLHRDERGMVIAAGIHTHPADRYSITTRVGSPR